MTDLGSRRVQYETAGLDVADVDAEPLVQWQRWYEDASAAGVVEPNAMTVATAGLDLDGTPDARVVLARGVDDRSVLFYTNYDSAKSRQLTAVPRAAAVFAWLDLHRQVRLRGTVERVDEATSDAYFASRPRGSQIGAWASPQSEVLDSREQLEQRTAEIEARFTTDETVPRPPFWGGWRLVVETAEFWQGRPSRLHDRVRYRRGDLGAWVIERLAP